MASTMATRHAATRPGNPRSRRPGATRRRTKQRLTILSFIAPALIGIVIFFVYPLIASVFYSFTRFDLVSDPEFIGFRNYEYLFTKDPKVATAALNPSDIAAPGRSAASRRSDRPCGRQLDLSWAISETRDCASDRHSSTAACNAAGVNGLRRQREAPSSSAILRKSGAGVLRLAKA